MLLMFKALLLALPLMTPLAACADCDAMVDRLDPRSEIADKPPVYACKVLPFDPALTVVALANSRKGDDYHYDLAIAVFETAGEKLVARLDRKSDLYSDANALFAITIDTGRFMLAKGVRAFGVRATNTHTGGVMFDGQTLALYVLDNKQIKPVMDRIMMHSAMGNLEFQDCYSADSVTRTLATDASSHFGYADLILTGRRESIEVTEKGGKCQEQKSASTERHVLRFDGRKYQLPAVLAKELAN